METISPSAQSVSDQSAPSVSGQSVPSVSVQSAPLASVQSAPSSLLNTESTRPSDGLKEAILALFTLVHTLCIHYGNRTPKSCLVNAWTQDSLDEFNKTAITLVSEHFYKVGNSCIFAPLRSSDIIELDIDACHYNTLRDWVAKYVSIWIMEGMRKTLRSMGILLNKDTPELCLFNSIVRKHSFRKNLKRIYNANLRSPLPQMIGLKELRRQFCNSNPEAKDLVLRLEMCQEIMYCEIGGCCGGCEYEVAKMEEIKAIKAKLRAMGFYSLGHK